MARFNSQPPEGGWPLAKSWPPSEPSFNSQPPEGGWRCHDAVDGRLKTEYTHEELQTAFAAGVMRTQQILIKQGLLKVG